MLPIDRTTLAAAQGNQVPYAVASPTKNINAIKVVFDGVDEVNAKVDNHTAASLLPHADGSVAEAKIADGAVTTRKIALQAVTSSRIANGAVGALQLDPTLTSDFTPIAIQAEFDRRVGLSVMKFGAVGDGVHDDTAAFRLAGAAAIASRTTLLLPTGRYLITDEIEFNEAFAMIGVGLDQGNGGRADALGSIIVFTNNSVDGSLNATKCLFRFKKVANYRLHGMRIENIGIVHTSIVKNQHSIIIDGAEFSNSKLRNMSFLDVTGYAIQFSGATYSQNLNWENLSFIRVGGCIGRSGTAQSLTVTMAVFTNFNLEVVNPISAQAILYDFSGMRHYSVDTLLCEGSMTGVTSNVTGLKMGTTYGNSVNTYRNVWFEFSGAKQLTYSIETIQGGYFQIEAIQGITSVSPINLGGDSTTLIIRGMDSYGLVPNSMITYTSTKAKVIFEGVLFDHLQSVPSSKIGVLELKNCMTYLGGGKTRFSQASDCILYRYNGGFIENNKFVAVPKKGAYQVTDVYIDSDATEGRYLVFKNSLNNELPNVTITVSVPPELYGSSIVIATRYKIVTADSGSTVQFGYNTSSDPSSRTQNYNVKNTWQSCNIVFRNVSGNITITPVNSGYTSAHDFYLSDLVVSVGDSIPLTFGKMAATQSYESKLAAIPTTGTYIVGDKIYFNTTTASGKIGAVCTTAGSPGTWKPFGAIDA